MTTLKHPTLPLFEDESTSYREDSPVNRSVLPAKERERTITVTSGRRCLEQLERFNHVGSWAKTFSELLVGMKGWYSSKCVLTWKLKGTKSNRLYFQLAVSTLPTEEIEFGLLLPTPQARDYKGQCAKTQCCLPNYFKTSQPNPLFVAEMMGFPPYYTVYPFQNGDGKASKPTEMQ